MIEIQAGQLRVGDAYYDAKWSDRAGWFIPDSTNRTSRKVPKAEPCGVSKIHVNGSMCYDVEASVFRV